MSKKPITDNSMVVWVSCNDEGKGEQVVSEISATLDNMGISNFHVMQSAKNPTSLLDVMKDYDPSFFIRPMKNTYQDLYYDRDKRVDNARRVLEVLGKEPGEANARMAIDSALTILTPSYSQMFEQKEGELKNDGS